MHLLLPVWLSSDFHSNRKLFGTCMWMRMKTVLYVPEWLALIFILIEFFSVRACEWEWKRFGTWRNGSVRFGLIHIDGTYKGYELFHWGQSRSPGVYSSIKTCSRFPRPITSYSFCAYRPRTPHVLCTYPSYVSARTPRVLANPRDIPYRCAWELGSASFILVHCHRHIFSCDFFAPRKLFQKSGNFLHFSSWTIPCP